MHLIRVYTFLKKKSSTVHGFKEGPYYLLQKDSNYATFYGGKKRTCCN